MHRFTMLWGGLLPLAILLLLLVTPDQSIAMADGKSNNMAEFTRRLAIFSINLYEKLSLLKPNENVVFSPFSIQTCAAMARMGAEGDTAKQLDNGLGLIPGDLQEIANSYHKVLAAYENSNILHIANKIYVMQGFSLDTGFNSLLTDKFLSSAENLDFSHSTEAAATINSWVEQRTNNLIKNLVSPGALGALTRLVLVNAIHFKGTWLHQFPKSATQEERFHLNDAHSIKVPMMNLKERFRYADLPNLDATALEMPYKDSDLSMLVILPNSKTGLAELEKKLQSVPLSLITDKLYSTQVIVKFPKFKAEFSIELTDVFKQLGMERMFSDRAEFGKMLQSKEQVQVSAVIHKAFIDVNEEGTEAAAATAILMRRKRCADISEPVEFLADHPFIYILTHREMYGALPLFFGSVHRLSEVSARDASTINSHSEL